MDKIHLKIVISLHNSKTLMKTISLYRIITKQNKIKIKTRRNKICKTIIEKRITLKTRNKKIKFLKNNSISIFK